MSGISSPKSLLQPSWRSLWLNKKRAKGAGGEFLYHIRTRPQKSVVNCEKVSNFVASRKRRTYLMKVFSLLSLVVKSDSFPETRVTTTLIICIGMRFKVISYTGVGSCNRLFVLGFVRTSYQINGTAPHFLFVLTRPTHTPSRSRMVI